ncbi:MAG: 5'-deoxynucleotidase [Oscillospiraceae bacterium]|jgi:5'-deoxynucleotidase|nr:5'-deoxynucleotidase [Oscillospiraceae bacterium]
MSSFFAMLDRMKYISRWALMRNSRTESLSEHAQRTAWLAHALAVLRNRRFGGSVDPERAALLALFHDSPEAMTGDLPTPVKYYSEDVREAYRTVEEHAARQLLEMLPKDLREDYAPLLFPSQEDAALWIIVKAADTLCAYLKCLEETRAGNREFAIAAAQTRRKLTDMALPELDAFLTEFVPAFERTLDEMRTAN